MEPWSWRCHANWFIAKCTDQRRIPDSNDSHWCFLKIPICLPANWSDSHKCSQGKNRHHGETFIFTDNSHYGQRVRIYIDHDSRNNSNSGHNNQMRHYKAPANFWQAWKDARLTPDQLENGLRGISTTMAQTPVISRAQLEYYISLQYWMWAE